MTTTLQQTLTPTTDVQPAVLRIPERRLSGADWAMEFRGSTSIADMEPDFSIAVGRFLEAIQAAGGKITIAATYRPPNRAYLMHWAWKITRGEVKASQVPSRTGVNIEWDHGDDAKSRKAAHDMAVAFGITTLEVAPALASRHTEGKAIDMNVSWSGNLVIKDATGNIVTIAAEPRTGMNSKLHEVGKTYGVVKFWKGAKDKPHWSTDGK